MIGRLRYKLSSLQQSIKDKWELSKEKSRQFVIHVGRQTGKSYLLNLIAIEYCISNPGCTVVYVAPVEKKLSSFISGILDRLLADCPDELKPQRLVQKNQVVFSNGSTIHYFGSSNESHNSIRGLGSVSFLVLDEAGFFSNLNELISVVGPMVLRSNGVIVYSSSSPESPDHPFVGLIERARVEGWYVMHPTWDDKTIPPEALDSLAEILGGRDSSKWRREVGCELIVEKTKQVLPEFNALKHVGILPPTQKYRFYKHYVGFDPGFRDPNSVTFATYLFEYAKLYIEAEIVIPGKRLTIDRLATMIKDKVKELWGDSKDVEYWADPSNQTLLDEMGKVYQLHFRWTARDKKEQSIESLRVFINNSRLLVHPSCVAHRTMFENTIWKEDRTDYERSAAGYHGDSIDSTLYVYRNLSYDNPIPSRLDISPQDYHIPKNLLQSQADVARLVSADMDGALTADYTGVDQGDYDE